MSRAGRNKGRDLYGRVLHRVSAALERSEDEGEPEPEELEIEALTASEQAFIKAFLRQDEHWLAGWHAAAEECAALQRDQNARVAELDESLAQEVAAFWPQLSCASCGHDVEWTQNTAQLTCSHCGSHLLTAWRPDAPVRH